MRRPFCHLLLLLATVATLASCKSEHRYLYVEDAPHDEPMDIENNYGATIYPGDQLYIYVYSQFSESVKSFNEETNKGNVKAGIKGYQVSQSGNIIFPILGRIHVAGKTHDALGREIEARLIEGGYVTDPVVTVSIMNFHVTVIGEVKNPSTIPAIGEVKNPSTIPAIGGRLTIFEALAQCGDVTIDGLRTNVVVVRTNNGTQVVDTIDLTRKEVLNSPYYYLQQNDIVYVEPTPKKKKTAWRDEDWPQYINIGVQSLRVAYTTIYHIYQSKK